MSKEKVREEINKVQQREFLGNEIEIDVVWNQKDFGISLKSFRITIFICYFYQWSP